MAVKFGNVDVQSAVHGVAVEFGKGAVQGAAPGIFRHVVMCCPWLSRVQRRSLARAM